VCRSVFLLAYETCKESITHLQRFHWVLCHVKSLRQAHALPKSGLCSSLCAFIFCNVHTLGLYPTHKFSCHHPFKAQAFFFSFFFLYWCVLNIIILFAYDFFSFLVHVDHNIFNCIRIFFPLFKCVLNIVFLFSYNFIFFFWCVLNIIFLFAYDFFSFLGFNILFTYTFFFFFGVCWSWYFYLLKFFFHFLVCVELNIFIWGGGGGLGKWRGAFWKYHNHVKESLPAHDDEGREFGIISHNNNMPQWAKLVLQWAGKKKNQKTKKSVQPG
jgi:hypothetical protein